MSWTVSYSIPKTGRLIESTDVATLYAVLFTERWQSSVERAALEMRYGATHRGFESHSLRHN